MVSCLEDEQKKRSHRVVLNSTVFLECMCIELSKVRASREADEALTFHINVIMSEDPSASVVHTSFGFFLSSFLFFLLLLYIGTIVLIFLFFLK